MRRSAVLRLVTLGLAWVHTFPLSHHLGAFLRKPEVSEGWKGFGSLVAVGLYLLPVQVQVRGLRALWRRRALLSTVTWTLAAAHAVPLVDHFPKWAASGTWADAWRSAGTAFAIAWFVLPVSQQASLLTAVVRLTRYDATPVQRARVGTHSD
jgi:hypothetical protein